MTHETGTDPEASEHSLETGPRTLRRESLGARVVLWTLLTLAAATYLVFATAVGRGILEVALSRP